MKHLDQEIVNKVIEIKYGMIVVHDHIWRWLSQVGYSKATTVLGKHGIRVVVLHTKLYFGFAKDNTHPCVVITPVTMFEVGCYVELEFESITDARIAKPFTCDVQVKSEERPKDQFEELVELICNLKGPLEKHQDGLIYLDHEAIVSLCDTLFISPGGTINGANEEIFNKLHRLHRSTLIPGESDSFGPVTRVLVTPHGRVVY